MIERIRTRLLLGILGFMLMVLGFTAGTAVMSNSAVAQSATNFFINQTGVALSDTEQVFSNVYNKVSPSVVAISVLTPVGAGSGSGFVVDQEGHIVTNFHVIDNAQDIIVNFFDGTITRAEVVGTDLASDLAVIKVDLDPSRLQPVTFGSSDKLNIGQSVLAIGSPFGQRWTMTAGIVSALDRSIRGFEAGFSTGGVIQTDAPINPGNSGGPLLNLQGEVVGVNAQIRSAIAANSGVGFAIPSDLTYRVAQDLIELGEVNYSYIGIQMDEISLTVIEQLGLPNNTRGVVITDVVDNSPAENAGLRDPVTRIDEDEQFILESADIITGINGTPITGIDGLIAYLAANTSPGDQISLTLQRDGQEMKVPLLLGDRP